MKTFIRVTLALGLAACGGSGGDGRTDTSTDLAGPHTTQSMDDFAMVSSTDMAMASGGGTAGCSTTITCENGCISAGGTQATEMSCIAACDAKESTQAAMLEAAFKSCIQTACPATPEDMGTTAACAYDPSTGTVINQSNCNTCQMNAQASGGACNASGMACAASM